MEYLRQIEEDLQNLSNEAGKKYSEVIEATAHALQALKQVRETYVSEIRKKESSNLSVKFKASSELISPYILVCNHADCSAKLIAMSINGILLLLKYDTVLPSDAQNILRVLQIQVQKDLPGGLGSGSKGGSSFSSGIGGFGGGGGGDYVLKILQLLVQLVTLISMDRQNYLLLSEQTIATVLTISLTLTDSRHPVSVTTAALGTTRQIIAIIMDTVSHCAKDLQSIEDKTVAGNLEQSALYVWILQSTTLIVREMSLFMQGPSASSAGAGGMIKVMNVPQSFAMDVLFDTLNGWRALFHELPTLQLQLYNSVIPSLQFMLKNIHADFYQQQVRFGLTTASSFTVRIIQIARFILLEFWSADEFDDLEHMITLLLHGTLPMRDPSSQLFDGADSLTSGEQTQKGKGSPSNNDSANVIRNRIEEASSLISKFISSSTAANGSVIPRTISANTKSSSNSLGNVQIDAADVYIVTGRNLLVSSNVNHLNEGRIVPAHPAGCCLEALLSFLLTRTVHMMKSEVGIRCLLNLISHLSTYSANLVTSILSNEQLAKEWEKTVTESALFKILQEIVEDETIEREKSSSHKLESEKVSANENYDSGKLIHQTILSANSLKSSDVCLLAMFSIMYSMKILLRLSVFSKANESLPITSRLSDGSKYLFIPAIIDSLLLSSLSAASSTPSIIDRLQSSEVIQLMRNHAENIYESVLDACTIAIRVSEQADTIRCVNAITAQLAVMLGLLGLNKPCEITISVICKQSIPLWHGKELLFQTDVVAKEASPRSGSSAILVPRSGGFQSKHLQTLMSLLQLMHVMSDLISDWDCIVDCLEQFHSYYYQLQLQQLQQQIQSTPHQSPLTVSSKYLAVDQMEKIMKIIEKWKDFTRFLSTETLIKLMTSLVALSMNNMAVNTITTVFSPPNERESGSASNSTAVAGSSNLVRESFDSATFPFDITDIKRSSSLQAQQGSKHSPIHKQSASKEVLSKTSALFSSAQPPSSATKINYLQRGMKNGCVNFSLKAVIEISKKNAYRISSIWQMVTSHLRMMASMKSESSRSLSVMAIYDVIFAVVDQTLISGPSAIPSNQEGVNILQAPPLPLPVPPAEVELLREDRQKTLSLEELFHSSFIWKFIFPASENLFELNFLPRSGENDREVSSMSGKIMPTLSQSDILSCLKSLSLVRYVDVRANILTGLEHFLQELGQCLSADREFGGWKVVLEIISSVPLSMTDEAKQTEWNNNGNGNQNVSVSQERRPSTDWQISGLVAAEMDDIVGTSINPVLTLLPQFQWPRETLYDSFNCIVLIVDEFLHLILKDSSLTQAVLESLSLFGSQKVDINTSLTAVEMIWKVADAALKANIGGLIQETSVVSGDSPESKNSVVMDIMLSLLFTLSMDDRPELRHCAINTLFSAMCANSQIMKVEQWQRIFESIIFPLFTKTGERSRIAMKSQEEAVAPELKKGVKISMHHSRDSAHKQWSETRVLTLRGMLRLLRTCTKLLLCESWFHEIWLNSIIVCDQAILVAEYELEVAIAGVEVFFGMLTVITDFSSDDELVVASAASFLSAASSISNRALAAGASSSKATVITKQPTSAQSRSSEKKLVVSLEMASLELIEKCRSKLWNLTFRAVQQSALHCYDNVELAIAMCNKLEKLYRANQNGSFRYSANIRILLTILISISRPSIKPDRKSTAEERSGGNAPSVGVKSGDEWTKRGQSAELRRIIVSLFRAIKISDMNALELYLSAICEIIFSHQRKVLYVSDAHCSENLQDGMISGILSSQLDGSSHHDDEQVPELHHFSSVASELREELGRFLLSILQLSSSTSNTGEVDESESKAQSNISITLLSPSSSSASSSQALSIIIQRYFIDICASPMLRKLSSYFMQKQERVERIDSMTGGREEEQESNTYGPIIKLHYLLLAQSKSFISLLAVNQQSTISARMEEYWNNFDETCTAQSIALQHLVTLRRFLGIQFPNLLSFVEDSAFDCNETMPRFQQPSRSHQEDRWTLFYQLPFEHGILLQAIKQLFSSISSTSASPTASVNQWSESFELILLIFLCHLSPWRHADLYFSSNSNAAHLLSPEGSKGPEGGSNNKNTIAATNMEIFTCMSLMISSPRLASPQKVQLLQILLGSILQQLFILEEEGGDQLKEEVLFGQIQSLLRLMNDFCRQILFPSPPIECTDAVLIQNAVYSLCMIARQISKLLVNGSQSSIHIAEYAISCIAYFDTLIELSANLKVSQSFLWSRDLFLDDHYYKLTQSPGYPGKSGLASTQRYQSSMSIWLEILNSIVLINSTDSVVASTTVPSTTNAEYTSKLFRFVESYEEEAEDGHQTVFINSGRSAEREGVSDSAQVTEDAKYFSLEINSQFPSMLLYHHLIDLLGESLLPIQLRQKARSLLKLIDVQAMMEMVAQLSQSNQILSQQLRQTTQELKNIRSATAFPF